MLWLQIKIINQENKTILEKEIKTVETKEITSLVSIHHCGHSTHVNESQYYDLFLQSLASHLLVLNNRDKNETQT